MDPLRIALLTSHRATVDRLLADPNRGSVWELSIVNGSEPDADLLTPSRIDFILLAGDPYLLTEEVASRFAGKVLVIHDADLSIRDRAFYAGPHPVRDAIFSGEPETRSSVCFATHDVARGPLFLLGPRYPVAPMALDAHVRGDSSFLYAYAELHRRWMQSAWGDLLARSIELLAGGTMHVIGDIVWIDGAPGPCRMFEAPSACHEPDAMLARGIPRSCPFIG